MNRPPAALTRSPAPSVATAALRGRHRKVGWRDPSSLRKVFEAVGVVLSPVVAFFVLRLRGMAPMAIPDPSIHSTYIFDPRDMFRRYSGALSATARLREGARVGFLVPARLAYLVFGAVPGFFVLRYVLAIVAVGPAYLLLRRLYGVGAGALAVAVIMASPVFVAAWGSDFPDSAVISYLIGGLACLVMPVANRRSRIAWLAGAAVLFVLAVWALATCGVLVATTLVVFAIARRKNDRKNLLADVSVLATVAIAVTLGLAVASWLELGQFDYIKPTIDALRYLDTPTQAVLWHSTNWQWAPYDAYLLVPPAIAAGWFVAFGRHWPAIRFEQRVVGLVLGAECVVAVYIQFFNHVQVVEEPYFSSALWSAAALTSILTLAELTQPLARYRVLRFTPALLVITIALAYEIYPHVPAFGWFPVGFIVVGFVVGGAVVGACLAADPNEAVARFGGAAAVVMMSGAALVLTVAPSPTHAALSGTVFDPPTSYATALGGSAAQLIEFYRLTSEVPGFVGHPAYAGEQLLTCWSSDNAGATPEHAENLSVIGLFHGEYNLLPGYCPGIGAEGFERIAYRRAAQVLVVSESPMDISLLLSRLAPLQPDLVRRTVLHSGSSHLDLWLIDIRRYLRPARTP